MIGNYILKDGLLNKGDTMIYVILRNGKETDLWFRSIKEAEEWLKATGNRPNFTYRACIGGC